jgi:hypothetical protein
MGGYIVMAPSLHPSGARYAVMGDWESEPGPVPDTLADLLLTASKKLSVPASAHDVSQCTLFRQDGQKWLRDALAKAAIGARNDVGYWLACQLRDDGIPFPDASVIMREYAQRVPQGINTYLEVEALKTLTSAYNGTSRDPARAPVRNVTKKAQDSTPQQLRQPPNLQHAALHWAEKALLPQPPVDWVIEDLISAGSVVVISGEGGIGKTYVVMDMALSVALGEQWLGFKTRQGVALFVDEESGPRRIARRIAEILRGHDAQRKVPMAYVSLVGFDLRDPISTNALRELIQSIGARLVALDALADIMLGGDENSVTDIQTVFHNLRQIAETTQSAILVIHHTNKRGGYRGSTAIKGAADLMLMMQSDGDDILFQSEKTRDIEAVAFHGRPTFDICGPSDHPYSTYRLEPSTVASVKSRLSTNETLIMQHLAKHNRASVSDMVNAIDNCSPNSARQAIYSLVKKGKIRRINPGGRGSRAVYELIVQESC